MLALGTAASCRAPSAPTWMSMDTRGGWGQPASARYRLDDRTRTRLRPASSRHRGAFDVGLLMARPRVQEIRLDRCSRRAHRSGSRRSMGLAQSAVHPKSPLARTLQAFVHTAALVEVPKRDPRPSPRHPPAEVPVAPDVEAQGTAPERFGNRQPGTVRHSRRRGGLVPYAPAVLPTDHIRAACRSRVPSWRPPAKSGPGPSRSHPGFRHALRPTSHAFRGMRAGRGWQILPSGRTVAPRTSP